MGKKTIVVLLVGLALTSVRLAEAPPRKVSTIGFFSAASASSISARTEAFRQGLRELGYVEGKNVVVEWRSAEGKADLLPALGAELVRLKVDVIITAGPQVTRVAREATSTIPIVMAFDNDPIGSGHVASLARPGGNITGLSTLSPELSGKQLELLTEVVPRLSRVGVFGTSTQPSYAQVAKEMEVAAGALGVKLQYLDLLSHKDIESAFRAASEGRADAVLALQNTVLLSQRRHVVELAVKSHLPAIYYTIEYVEEGGFMTYSVNVTACFVAPPRTSTKF